MLYYVLSLIIISLSPTPSRSEVSEWSVEEIDRANTAKHVAYLNEVEKETLLYLNLARLYPEKYAEFEIPHEILLPRNERAKWQSYRRSLLKELKYMKPLHAIKPDSILTDYAKCFADESGNLGLVGHQRVRCAKKNISESCSYGKETGRDIVLQLLIDYNVPTLGHRYDCLDPLFTIAGLGYSKHIEFRHCLVLTFK